METQDRIVIAGAGIGGLCTALALARQGISTLVLEKAPEIKEIGAGIQLGPNAFHALDSLGIGEVARSVAVFIDSLRLMDAVNGDEITRIPLNEQFLAHYKNPYAVVHRGNLHSAILKVCKSNPLVSLSTNSEVVGYTQDSQKVTVHFGNGESVCGSALIGADGLWSKVREQVVGDGPPRRSGHATYRSVIPTELMPESLRWNAATLWAGPKCHIVHYPLVDSQMFNLVVTYHNDIKTLDVGKPVSVEEVSAGFSGLNEKCRQIVECGMDWKLWVLCDREPVLKWTDSKVALLGDAAHPMMQYFAQGACMAIEDAVCLASEVAKNRENKSEAFLAYEKRRVLRTTRVQMQSRLIGDHIYHPDGARAALRDSVLKGRTVNEWFDSIDWLYGHDGTDTVAPYSNSKLPGMLDEST